MTGLLYASMNPSADFSCFKAYPTTNVEIISISPSSTNSKVLIDNKNTYHELTFTLQVTAGSGSVTVNQKMAGNSEKVVDVVDGESKEFILKGDTTESQDVSVPQPSPASSITVSGVYVECISCNQTTVSEV